MPYRQITAAERYALMVLQVQGFCPAAIARALGRHRSTITRELARKRTRHDGYYRPQLADWYARGRRSHSRRHTRFTPAQWAAIEALLCQDWSPEQIVGWYARFHLLAISHETIYRHIWADKRRGGRLHVQLRCANKPYRKRYGRYDSRGRLAGKRPIATRPPGAEHRSRYGHWEGDTVLGDSQGGACLLTLVERKSGYTLIGKLARRSGAAVNARARRLIAPPTAARAHDHRGQRHGVSCVRGARGHRADAFLLRDAAPRVRTRDEREHQWASPPVSPQAGQHGTCDPTRLHAHRDAVEPASTQTP